MYHSAQPADGMKLITKVVYVLRSAIAEIRSLGKIARLSHLATFSPCGAADFYRLGVHKEEILAAIHFQGNPLADGFAQPCRFPPAVIELPARYEIRNLSLVFLQFVLEKPILAVDAFRFGRQQQSHDLQIREFGDRATADDIPMLINKIVGELLAYLEYSDEFCVQVVHTLV